MDLLTCLRVRDETMKYRIMKRLSMRHYVFTLCVCLCVRAFTGERRHDEVSYNEARDDESPV